LPIKFAAILSVCFALCQSLAAAQQTTPSPNSDPTAQAQPQTLAQGQPAPSAQSSQSDKDTDKNKRVPDAKDQPSGTSSSTTSGTSNDRLFYALPNFLSLENGATVRPLTSKQKFEVVARGSFDKVEFAWYGLISGISQADNSEPGFGQGWAGFGKRYGATFADGTIENFMTEAILPSLFHQDPRFFESGKGGFGRRSGYAVSRIFVTRTDSGHQQFNFSEILGSALSAGISTYSYHPRGEYVSTPTNPHLFVPSDRTLSNTAKVWGTQVGYDTFTIVIKEFWPDIHRKLSHKHNGDAPGSGESVPSE
jgi:hypothetical protein